jgi:hypothetical protein
MILDNLSIVGLFVTSLYLLLPLLFGKELWRVDEGVRTGVTKTASSEAGNTGAWDCIREPASCADS